MILIIILIHFIAMQIRAELRRILQEPDVTKARQSDVARFTTHESNLSCNN